MENRKAGRPKVENGIKKNRIATKEEWKEIDSLLKEIRTYKNKSKCQ